MKGLGHRTNTIKVGNSGGIRIPKIYLESLGEKVVLEKTKEGVLIRPAGVAPLKEWGKLFEASNSLSDPGFDEWEITLSDGIE
jgi:antitoxin MazE